MARTVQPPLRRLLAVQQRRDADKAAEAMRRRMAASTESREWRRAGRHDHVGPDVLQHQGAGTMR